MSLRVTPAKKNAYCKEELEVCIRNCILAGSDTSQSSFKNEAFEFQECFRKKEDYSLKCEEKLMMLIRSKD